MMALVFGGYREVLSLPGTRGFALAGIAARVPISMSSLSIIMLISLGYGSYGVAGLASAAYVSMAGLLGPQIAKLVDRHGQARVMLPLVTISALALLVIAVLGARHVDPAVLVGLAAVSGATQGPVTSLTRARWTHAVRNPSELHTAYALEAALDEVTFMLGPVLATTLATALAPWAPVVATAVIQFVGGYALLLQRGTEPPPRPVDGTPGSARNGSVLGLPVMWLILGVYLMVGLVFGGIDVATVAFAEEQGRPGMAGAVLMVFALGSFLAGIVYGARAWPGAVWKHYVGGTVMLTMGAASFFLADSLAVLAVMMFFAGLFLSPTFVAGQKLVQQAVAPSRLTEGLAWTGTALAVGVSGGALAAGQAIDQAGSPGAFAVCVAAAALALVLAGSGSPLLRRLTSRP